MAGKTTRRGYGWKHQQARQRWAAVVASGRAVCTRCGLAVLPGSAWHLDHSDDRTTYLGVAHARCNLSAGGRKGKAAQRAARGKPTPRRVSTWCLHPGGPPGGVCCEGHGCP